MSNSHFPSFRCYLRAIEPEDWQTSHPWRNRDETWETMYGRRYFVSREAERQWVQRAMSETNNVRLAICLKEEDRHIGYAYLMEIDWFHRCAHTAKWIGEPQHRGQGYGTEAGTLILWHAFFELGLNRVTSRQLSDNIASIRHLEKCGYRHEGTMRSAVFKHGTFKDVNLMAILRDEFVEHLRDRYGMEV